MRVAVAGGTGTVGRHVVDELRRRGHETVVLTRSTGADVRRRESLAEPLAGAEAVVDCLNVATTRGRVAADFFTTTTRNLAAAGAEAGVARHVVLSIVGIDRTPTGYYRAKLAQEAAARESAVPVTILRATQFHEFPAQLLAQLRTGPVVFAPRMTSAPVAAAEVACALVDLVEQPPAAGTVELGGPERLDIADLIARLAVARGVRARVVPLRLPGAGGRAMRSGELVPDSPWRTGTQTWDEWLAEESQRA